MTAQSTSYYNYRALQSNLQASEMLQNDQAQLAPNVSGIAPLLHIPNKGASELISILSNTVADVKKLMVFLHDKGVLEARQNEYRHCGMILPPNLSALSIENDKKITVHYAIVGEGVKRVNTVLQKCHTGEIRLNETLNQLANRLRAELIKYLERLSSGVNHSLTSFSTGTPTGYQPLQAQQHMVGVGASAPGASYINSMAQTTRQPNIPSLTTRTLLHQQQQHQHLQQQRQQQ